MRTPGADGLGAAVQEVAERTTTVTRLEVELATLELRHNAAALGEGAALVAAAALLALFALGFFFAGVAAALATFMPTWAALLVMAGMLLLVGAGVGVAGRVVLRRGVPPVPEQAIAEAQLTTTALRESSGV
jgi:Putative Actinobacterial Holin-X, holin superfamily III